jgi:signal transduction histidine kinase
MPVEEELYRIAQEALHNVVKHARARQVEVRLSSGSNGTRLEVRDDGVGFQTDRARPGSGMGLSSMRERAEALGGSFQIHSGPGSGTRVEVVVSWEPGAKGEDEKKDPGAHR